MGSLHKYLLSLTPGNFGTAEIEMGGLVIGRVTTPPTLTVAENVLPTEKSSWLVRTQAEAVKWSGDAVSSTAASARFMDLSC